MPTHKTPGVYVEEISTLPPSVAEVSTAIPAFIGYTKNGPLNEPTRITSMIEYKELFGGAPSISFNCKVEGSVAKVTNTDKNEPPNYMMYYCLMLYFSNGGGPCYIVSVGKYTVAGTKSKDAFDEGLKALEKEDEPTLIVHTDATNLADVNDYYQLCVDALGQCHTLRDRFTIFDMVGTAADFRKGVGNDYLMYGAAYHPYLQTSLNYEYKDHDVTVKITEADPPVETKFVFSSDLVGHKGFKLTYAGSIEEPKIEIQPGGDPTDKIEFEFDSGKLTIKGIETGKTKAEDVIAAWTDRVMSQTHGFSIGIPREGTVLVNKQAAVPLDGVFNSDPGGQGIAVYYDGSVPNANPEIEIQEAKTPGKKFDLEFEPEDAPTKVTIKGIPTAGIKPADLITEWKNWNDSKKEGFEIEQESNGSTVVPTVYAQPLTPPPTPPIEKTLDKMTDTRKYNRVKTELAKQRVVLPPSSAMAGVYARVDRDRGVWKAPANVSLSSVIRPMERITNEKQDGLNIDPDGKSIDVIRSFAGKGTLVWGARTLAGNDNEWRYINVRRLFITIEESTQKATSFAVFEANDATTWLKVKGMIESYLYGLWEQGALAGPTPESAYFVNVGLGKTMTTQDVLEGRMNVEIGIAAVRPAEFIILKFSHKMQEA